MAVLLAPTSWLPTMDSNGDPLSGAKLFTYSAGSSTQQTTFTDSTGLVQQSNPIILGSDGTPADSVWITEGLTYKFVLAPSTDTDPPASPIKTEDNISGINDTSVTIDQWVASGLTPTFVSTTEFTLIGDQTSDFHVGRRLKSSVSGGTAYSTITVSAYTSLTTITVTNDATVLDSGISAISYGLLTSVNPSIPKIDLPAGSTVPDDSITTAKLADNAVTIAKMAGITAGNLIAGDSSGDPAEETYLKWVEYTSIDLTNSGSDDTSTWTWTGIPSSATALKLVISGMGSSTTGAYAITLGDSGGLETSGYDSGTRSITGTVSDDSSTSDYILTVSGGAAWVWQGSVNINKRTGNEWIADYSLHSPANSANVGGGSKTLSGVLTQLSLFVSSGTFDDGNATLWYYGNSEV